jgi:hypothetical protein
MQMPASTFRLCLCMTVLAALLPWGRPGLAGSISRGAAIKQVVYLYSVTEYCGLNTRDVYDGYRREIRDLTREGRLPESTVRWLRIHGIIAADLEYDNRGLGGFRIWCRTEGVEAAKHFLAFRDGQLAVDGIQTTAP